MLVRIVADRVFVATLNIHRVAADAETGARNQALVDPKNGSYPEG